MYLFSLLTRVHYIQFAILFPSEVLAKTGKMVQRDDIWTLNYRTMLLLHVIMRTRENPRLSLAERAQLSVQAWMEIDDIEQRLNYHTCDMDSVFGFQARELLFACVFRSRCVICGEWKGAESAFTV